ncbi:MAG: flagellar basal body rod protein FlgB [Oligoflexales bacterium]|nr:flagellar basal body rod protein FlgB [Oligoflexales bacterium]
MGGIIGGIFDFGDRIQMESLNQRVMRSDVISSNIANAETPGYRAIGYDFEEQLQSIIKADEPFPMKVSNEKHLINEYAEADGAIYPDVFLRPTESVGQDGNTVDVDAEMAQMAQNQLQYHTTVELLNRKIGVLKYAIASGGR